MELQLRKSLKLFNPPISSPTFFFFCPRNLHPLFLTITRSSRSPSTSLPSSHTQPCPFISSLPSRFLQSLHFSAPPTSSLHIKLLVLHQHSFSPSQVKLLLDNPYFLAASTERVSSLISLFRAKDESGALATMLLTRSPCIFKYKAENLEAKCQFFLDLGIGLLGLRKLLTNMRAPTVLASALKTLQRPIDFLQRIGLSKTDIIKVIRRCPGVLCSKTDAKMEATMVFFERHGLSKHEFLSFVKKHPNVFGISIDRYLTKKVEFLRWLGLDFPSKRSARALITWATSSSERLLSGWGILKNQGFSEDDVLKIVLQQAEVLTLREDSIKRKIDYLKNVLSRDLQEVIKFPGYLSLSLENRIIPRFTFLNEVKESGQHKKKHSLSYLLIPSDAMFERQHAGYLKWKAKHKKKQEEQPSHGAFERRYDNGYVNGRPNI